MYAAPSGGLAGHGANSQPTHCSVLVICPGDDEITPNPDTLSPRSGEISSLVGANERSRGGHQCQNTLRGGKLALVSVCQWRYERVASRLGLALNP